MLFNEPRAREARRDTLAHLAPERSLKRLSRLYRLPWVTGEAIPLESQRAFIHATLYSARGTYGALFSSVRALFGYSEVEITATLTFITGGALGLYLESPSISESWARDRFIELEQGDTRAIFRSSHLSGSRLFLSPMNAASHTSVRQALDLFTGGAITARLLPFRIEEPQPQRRTGARRERPCEVILEIDENVLVEIPPSYYRENGDARTTDPQGLHMMTLEDPSIPSTGDIQTGPFPLYYFDENAVSEFLRELFDDLLAAGVRLTARRRRM